MALWGRRKDRIEHEDDSVAAVGLDFFLPYFFTHPSLSISALSGGEGSGPIPHACAPQRVRAVANTSEMWGQDDPSPARLSAVVSRHQFSRPNMFPHLHLHLAAWRRRCFVNAPRMPANSTTAEIVAAMRSAQRIAVVAHVRPDGDAVGSVLGLALSLRALGKDVIAMLEDGVPANLAFLPGTDTVIQPGTEPLNIDLAIALDTATHERVGEKTKALLDAAPLLVDIDHHPANPGYGGLNYIDATSPATGQIIYNLLSEHGLPIDDAVRQNLFIAISTDTGSFQFSSTNARTHRIVAEMMDAGLDTARLAQLVYQSYPVRRLELMRDMLNHMEFRAEGRIVSWQLKQEVMDSISMQPGDTEGLIDTLRMIDSVVTCVIFEDIPGGKVRVSSRSKDNRLDVSVVCAQFGGGGHRMASGARMKGPIGAAAEKFLQALEHEVRRID
jgi:bifunctional oligoribonuclease and PAP phosphatase NrnA